MTRRGRIVVGVVVALGLLATFVVLLDRRVGPLGGPSCTAEVDGHRVELGLEEAQNAALITAISVRRGMPARAASIALATVYQESKMLNIEHGDRDSLGLFQQRPSQGWGTDEEVLDPVYATHAFYDALEKVPGYREMEITEAAQAVQRSGYPQAYAAHEEDARTLASALTGHSGAAFWCAVPGRAPAGSAEIGPDGLVPRADVVRRELEGVFGPLSLGGYAPGGVSTGHMKGSAHYAGRAVDVFVRPINLDNTRRGWALASYLVAQSDRLDIATVIFDGRIWHAGSRSRDGWSDYRVPSSSRGDRAILEHRDHVHVDVLE